MRRRRTYSEDLPGDRVVSRGDDVIVEEETVEYDRTPDVYDETVVEERGGWYIGDLATRINTVLFAVLAAIEGLLALRFLLAAFGANRTSGFVDFIYDVSWPFVRPFDGAFNNRTWDEGVIELSTLLAMGVWALAFALAAMLVSAVVPRYDDTHGGGYRRRHVTHA